MQLSAPKMLRKLMSVVRLGTTNDPHGELDELIPEPGEPEVRSAFSEAELKVVSRLDKEVYRGESIDHEGLCSWWRRYPKGVYLLWKDLRIIGAVGIWPLVEEAYGALVRGDLDEVDLKAQHIERPCNGRLHAYWYFADVVLERKYRKKDKLPLVLLEGSMDGWLSEGNLAPQVHVCAFGFTTKGIRLLKKFKFIGDDVNPVRSPRAKPVYERISSIEGLRKDLDSLRALLKKSPARSPGPKADRFDVFMSYKRSVSSEAARLIRSELGHRQLRVFLDVDDLRPGHFDEELIACIERTPNFLVILSPGCLDHAFDEEDWFRQEIAVAVKAGKNIVPIIMPMFNFPQSLPPDIQVLKTHQAITYSHEFFDAMIDKVLSYIRS